MPLRERRGINGWINNQTVPFWVEMTGEWLIFGDGNQTFSNLTWVYSYRATMTKYHREFVKRYNKEL